MLPIVAALTLSLWADPVPQTPFESITQSQLELAGGGSGVGPSGGQYAGAYLLGALGSGAAFVVGLPLLSLAGSNNALAFALLSVPGIAAAALHVGIGSWLGVPVSWGSALLGAFLGYVSGVALGVAFIGKGTGDGLGDLAYFLVGIIVGFTLGTPLWTLVDPLGLAEYGGSGGGLPPARPLSTAAREPSDALAPLAWSVAF